jgi:hypothetical protein
MGHGGTAGHCGQASPRYFDEALAYFLGAASPHDRFWGVGASRDWTWGIGLELELLAAGLWRELVRDVEMAPKRPMPFATSRTT